MTNFVLIVSAAVLVVFFLIGVLPMLIKLPPSAPIVEKETRLQLLSLASDLELPNHSLANGISDPFDLQYVRRVAPGLRDIFMKERVRLARLWLSENRHQLSRLMRLHRLIARHNVDFSVSTEMQVIGSCMMLQAILLSGDALVMVAGPFRARRMGLLSMSLFDQLSTTVGSTVATLDAAQRASIRADWARLAS